MVCITCNDTSEANITKCVYTALDTIHQHMQAIARLQEAAHKENSSLLEKNKALQKQLERLRVTIANSPANSVTRDSQRRSMSNDPLNTGICFNASLDECIAETQRVVTPRKIISLTRTLSTSAAPLPPLDNNRENLPPSNAKRLALNGDIPDFRRNLSLSHKAKRTKFSPKATAKTIDSPKDLYTAISQAKNSQMLKHSAGRVGKAASPLAINKLTKAAESSSSFRSTRKTALPLHASKSDSSFVRPASKSINDSNFENINSQCTEPTPTLSYLTPKKRSTDADSVVMLTPETQDIIFLDESEDMGDNFERKSIAIASMLGMQSERHLSYNDEVIPLPEEQSDELSFELSGFNTPTKPAETEEHVTMPLALLEVKQEPGASAGAVVCDGAEDAYADADADFNERGDLNRFEKCCDKCNEYAKLFAGYLRDEYIHEKIAKCKNKSRPARAVTPEGFWNPLMVSFAEDDPRNQILIDDRFKNKH